MKHKTIQQLRDTLNKVLKRGRPKQLKKLQKAYHGKRLKMWWASYAQFEKPANFRAKRNGRRWESYEGRSSSQCNL
jgi:hypothetical protein